MGDPVLQPSVYDGGSGQDTIGYLERFIPLQRAFENVHSPIAVAAAFLGNRLVKLMGPGYRLRLEKNYGIANVVDCAVARPVSRDAISDEIVGLGKVTGMGSVRLGMPVRKSGRTSGVTSGKVIAVDVTLQVELGSNEIALFTDQVVADRFSLPGDSGSLIVDEDMRAVGLLFAGSHMLTVFNKISNVLDALGIIF